MLPFASTTQSPSLSIASSSKESFLFVLVLWTSNCPAGSSRLRLYCSSQDRGFAPSVSTSTTLPPFITWIMGTVTPSTTTRSYFPSGGGDPGGTATGAGACGATADAAPCVVAVKVGEAVAMGSADPLFVFLATPGEHDKAEWSGRGGRGVCACAHCALGSRHCPPKNAPRALGAQAGAGNGHDLHDVDEPLGRHEVRVPLQGRRQRLLRLGLEHGVAAEVVRGGARPRGGHAQALSERRAHVDDRPPRPSRPAIHASMPAFCCSGVALIIC